MKRLFIEWLEWETTHREMPPGEMFSTTSRRRSINTGHYSCPLQLSSSLDFSRTERASQLELAIFPLFAPSNLRVSKAYYTSEFDQSFFRFERPMRVFVFTRKIKMLKNKNYIFYYFPFVWTYLSRRIN